MLKIQKILNTILSHIAFTQPDEKRLFIACWREGKNFGDDYLSLSLKTYLTSAYPTLKIIETNLHLDNYVLTQKDILIIGGGGLWGPSGSGHLSDKLYSIWINTKAKLIIANIGIESFDPSSAKMLTALCSKAELFSLRDKKSWLIVKETIGEGKAFLAADNTYLGSIQIKREPVKGHISVNLCGPEQENFRKDFPISSIIKSINELSKRGFIIKAVPFTYKGTLSDYKYCKEIDPNCPECFSTEPYSDCELFIGMHFHSIILALQNNIPVFAINYSDKVKRLMQEYGLNEYCVEPDDPDMFNKMLSFAGTIDKNDILNKIRKGNENAKERLVPFKSRLQEIIDGNEEGTNLPNLKYKFKLLFMRLLNKINPKFRWFLAQKYETAFWKDWLKINPGGNDDKWLNAVLNYFELKENQDFGNATIVDIGSGPIGILTKFKAKERIAIDPLGIESLDKTIKRIKASGEEIPLSDRYADKVFMYNVLQHVRSPEKVLEEGTRILKTGGTFYILDQLNLPTNEGHPNSLKLSLFDKWLKKSNFEIVKKLQEDDCYFEIPKELPGSGYSVLCLILKKRG
jgi:polysaccharide pyruvyl transferase WcaK-like protein/ubiquinone/menaquinone biosynthesis C-methylase UbiE